MKKGTQLIDLVLGDILLGRSLSALVSVLRRRFSTFWGSEKGISPISVDNPARGMVAYLVRQAPGGMIFHVLNRGNARDGIFEKDADYAAFEAVLLETQEAVMMRILSYCLMPNHWHLVLWPLHDGDLGRFMQRLTTTHVRRWHLHHHTVGTGHLYQGTYKSFPIDQLPQFARFIG